MDYLFDDEVIITVGNTPLEGQLVIPEEATGLVIFSHGSGSSRLSPRNKMVADYLQRKNLGTLLFDLLTKKEDEDYHTRFNIDLLTERLIGAALWLHDQLYAEELKLAFFGASTGAASALRAAAVLPQITAVVSRGGRPDLAMPVLKKVQAPTLLLVGSRDPEVLKLNELAYAQLECEKKLQVIEGATHLFEEPGTMDEVCEYAGEWFRKHMI